MSAAAKPNWSRRSFIKATLAAASVAWLPRTFGTSSARRPPNILLILTDEHNAGVLGCYGNRLARTPYLDALSGHGITFDRCYCSSPMCVPSRAGITTGKYSSRVAAWNNNCDLPSADCASLPRILNAAGYQSYLCGKMHYGVDRRYGFTEIGGNMNKFPKTGLGYRRAPDDLTPPRAINVRFKEFHVGDHSPVLEHDRRVTNGVVDFLGKREIQSPPFFLLAGYVAPHFPLVVSDVFWRNFAGRVPMPNIPPGSLESLPLNYRQLRIGYETIGVPDSIVQLGRELYYGLTEWVDQEIGKVIAALKDSAVAHDTIVIYASDHGENMGEHGMWWKSCMYEHATRVPLIVSWSARWPGGHRRTQACSLLDVVQTIAALGGAQVPSDWNGMSMVPWLDDPQASWKDYAVSEYYGNFTSSGFIMIRTGDYKYVYHAAPDERHPSQRELYDLSEDPGEFNNLADQPGQQERIRELHEMLIHELREQPEVTDRRARADLARGYGTGEKVPEAQEDR